MVTWRESSFIKGGGEGVTGQLCIFSYTSRRFKLGKYCPHPPNNLFSRFFLIFYTKVIQYMWNIFIFQFQGYFCHQNKIREKTEQIEVTWATPTLKCYTYLEQYGIHTYINVHLSQKMFHLPGYVRGTGISTSIFPEMLHLPKKYVIYTIQCLSTSICFFMFHLPGKVLGISTSIRFLMFLLPGKVWGISKSICHYKR